MSASGSGGSRWIARLNSLASVQNLDQAFTKILFLPIIAAGVQAAAAVEAISQIFILPVSAVGSGAANVASSFLNGIAEIIGVGASVSATGTRPFGIGAFPIGIAVIGGGLFVMAQILQQQETSDLVPGTFTDFPLVGAQEEADDQ